MGNYVEKKRKNSNFRTAKKRENISRPRFYGEWDRNNFEYPRIGPDLKVIFFYRHIFEKKKIFVCTAGLLISEKKKIVPVEKNFFSPPPNIEEYVLQINQSDRCLEDT